MREKSIMSEKKTNGADDIPPRTRRKHSSLGVIPARYESTRFPGKPLADLHGKPMVVRVYKRAALAGLDHLCVATDDPRIRDVCDREGVPVRLTRRDHLSGTERVAEAARAFQAEIVVNIQGDEPLIDPAWIGRVLKVFENDPTAEVVTVCAPLSSPEDMKNPNLVKVALDAQGRALDFSRKEIPGVSRLYGHIGLYAFRRETLERLVRLPPSERERAESLEQLRALEHGIPIACIVAEHMSWGVDTLEDLEKVRMLWKPIRP